MKTIPIYPETTVILPLLHELNHALEKLLMHKEEHSIDLHRLPISPTDKEQLLNFLGKGEAKAELNSLGRSMMWETTFPGVWLVEHYDIYDVLLTQTLEITWIPPLLKSQPEDIQIGRDKLQHYLSSSSQP